MWDEWEFPGVAPIKGTLEGQNLTVIFLKRGIDHKRGPKYLGPLFLVQHERRIDLPACTLMYFAGSLFCAV